MEKEKPEENEVNFTYSNDMLSFVHMNIEYYFEGSQKVSELGEDFEVINKQTGNNISGTTLVRLAFKNTENVKLVVSKTIPVSFCWKSQASSVYVCGSWSNWNTRHSLHKINGDWKLKIELPLGRHEYKYIVDRPDNWLVNPEQEVTSDGNNNVINVAYGQSEFIFKNGKTNCFLIEGAKIMTSDRVKVFECDILLDTGASIELSLPVEKVHQLDLLETHSEFGELELGHRFEAHYLFPDVNVQLPGVNNSFFEHALTAVYFTKPGRKIEIYSAPPQVSTTPIQPPTQDVEIKLSPVKNNSSKYKDLPILGFNGLVRMGLDVNFKHQTLKVGKLHL